MRQYLAAALLLFTTQAHANGTLEVGPGVCDSLVNYVEPPGVEYRPGIDASGNPIAPADIGGGSPIELPTKFTIPITDYLYGKLAGASGATTATTGNVVQPSLLVGVVTYDNGQLSFNGRPLTHDPDGELGELCRKARAR